MSRGYEKNDTVPENYYGRQRSTMLQYLPEDIKVLLDIGCGEGGFGEIVKTQRGAEVWGIELNDHAAKVASTKLDRVFTGNVETDQLELPDEYFDCIVFNDVLEHLSYPCHVLKKVKNMLKSDGYLLASIPNIRFYEQVKMLLVRGDWEYEISGIMDRTHMRFFTFKSAKRMFEENGYQVVTMEGINRANFPWKFNLLNLMLGGRLEDMRYVQFACLLKKCS